MLMPPSSMVLSLPRWGVLRLASLPMCLIRETAYFTCYLSPHVVLLQLFRPPSVTVSCLCRLRVCCVKIRHVTTRHRGLVHVLVRSGAQPQTFHINTTATITTLLPEHERAFHGQESSTWLWSTCALPYSLWTHHHVLVHYSQPEA
jgi:hypothetical protein